MDAKKIIAQHKSWLVWIIHHKKQDAESFHKFASTTDDERQIATSLLPFNPEGTKIPFVFFYLNDKKAKLNVQPFIQEFKKILQDIDLSRGGETIKTCNITSEGQFILAENTPRKDVSDLRKVDMGSYCHLCLSPLGYLRTPDEPQ